MIDRTKTLTELEGNDWGEPPYPSYLITTVYAVRKKPIGSLCNEELRVAIGQEMGLRFLLPVALDRLSEEPLSQGHLYPGDLFRSVIGLPSDVWLEEPDLWNRAKEIGDRFWTLADADSPWYTKLEREIREEYARFVSTALRAPKG